MVVNPCYLIISMEKKPTFGQVLRQLRQERDLGIKRIAPALNVNYTYLSKIENDKATPSDELIERIAGYFGCDRDTLYLAADKVPQDALDAIKRYPRESLEYLRNLSQDVDKSDR
jgi:transcriptional regulator with XRE-family HTH domain